MISADQLRDRLQAVPLFARCHASDLQIVAQRSSIRSVDAGTELMRTNFKLVLEAVPGVAPELVAFLARRRRVADAPEPNEEL